MEEKSVTEHAYDLRRNAEAGPIGKRKTSAELYGLLADCMSLAERCAQDHESFDELRQLVAQQPHNGNRRYVEASADAFQLVARFVFAELKSPSAERSNANRYAICMREAKKRNVGHAGLAQWLNENGGLNALFLARPLTARSVTTKTLYLVESITIPKEKPITLTLMRQPDGRFAVV